MHDNNSIVIDSPANNSLDGLPSYNIRWKGKWCFT